MTLFELFGKIVIETEEAKKDIDDVKKSAEDLGKSFEDAGNNADTASEQLGENGKIGAASVWLGNTLDRIGVAAYNFAKKGIAAGYEYNKMMESYTASFKVLTGSEETAVKLLDDLWALAAETPLEMAGLADASTMLLNYGIAAENLIPVLRMLGDASMGDQNKLIGIARAYGQVLGYGQLRGQETNQLVENGFNILQLLSEMTGKTNGELLEMREKGQLTADMMTQAFIYATSEGGQYFQSMMEFAQTLEGQEAKLHDNLTQMLGNMMQPFTDVYKDTVLPGLSESIEKFNTFITENKDLLSSWAESLGAMATDGFDSVLTLFQWMIEHKDATVTALEAIGAAFVAAFSATHPYIAAIASVGIPMIDFLMEYTERAEALKTPEAKAAQEAVDEYAPKELAHERNWKLNENDRNVFKMLMGGISSGKDGTKIGVGTDVPSLEATAEEITTWLDSKSPEFIKQLDIVPPDSSATSAEIEAWWQAVRPSLVARFTMLPDGTFINNDNGQRHGGSEGGFRTGLDFVPRDNFVARLHQGEAVLTADEAREWRNGRNGRQEVYQEETIITGNTFVIQKEQDIYALAAELHSLKRESRRGRGQKN